MAIFSSKSTLQKIAWLNEKEKIINFSSLQLQKFLFFYEMLQYSDNEEYDFTSLKAYKNGPVFSKFYGDITYRRIEVINYIEENNLDLSIVNDNNANVSRYIVSSLNDKELSDLSHQFNFWSVHRKKIEIGSQQIPMYENDITADDLEIIELIKSSIPNYEYEIIKVGSKRFIVHKNQIDKFSDNHLEILDKLSRDDELLNPVFIELDNCGRVVID